MPAPQMKATAIVLQEPGAIALKELELTAPGDTDVVVDVQWSGVSSGTERLLWSGKMPFFPGLGYPLVPGYESAGAVVMAGSRSGLNAGDFVFVPGASCYKSVKGLFGASASRIVAAGSRAIRIDQRLGEDATLLALAATAHRAVAGGAPRSDGTPSFPELIVGHGVLGRLAARVVVALGGAAPTVWETSPMRQDAGSSYRVIDPSLETRRDYRTICDVSGDATILDRLIGCLAPGGEIVLAGFYSEPMSFTFPPAFMREARFRISAEFKPDNISAICALIAGGKLSLAGLISHRAAAADAASAYRTAFTDTSCLKMVLDWRHLS